MAKSFKEKYCEKFGVKPEDFERSLFWKAAYPHVLILSPLIKMLKPNHFRADLELIESVGLCECLEEVRSEVAAFHWDASNGTFLRRRLRLRVSSNRILILGRRFLRQSVRKL